MRTRTVQQTGKFWKLNQVLGFLVMMSSFIVLGVYGTAPGPLIGSILLFIGGGMWWLSSRFLSWWFHG